MGMPGLRLMLREPQRHPAEDAIAFAGGIALGAVVGAIAAILLAPSDGDTLRRRLATSLGFGDDTTGDVPSAPTDSDSRGTGGPLLAPGNVATEERVVEQRLTAGAH